MSVYLKADRWQPLFWPKRKGDVEIKMVLLEDKEEEEEEEEEEESPRGPGTRPLQPASSSLH
ncbi:hypothetical protein EYF80_000353 [Liparis tanakae]|uniref:Uncharacterized protein n=1 Tax=Liparis tanakae TaxID=230148 RepID=A0A4Z2JFN2_9TELE|nr:hypothetical protein EYF80_000353 [Liparis tanakae]